MSKYTPTLTPQRHHRMPSGMSNLTPTQSLSSHDTDALSTHSSTFLSSSTASEPPRPSTRLELTELLHHMSAFALHYAAIYHALGINYHFLPLAARTSKWVIENMQRLAAEAFTASPDRQRPDMIVLLHEVGFRLQETKHLLGVNAWTLASAEVQLRRCDVLLREAEVHLRFLESVVGEMWFVVGRDEAVRGGVESLAEAGEREGLKREWAMVLPQMCFRPGTLSRSEKSLGWRRG